MISTDPDLMEIDRFEIDEELLEIFSSEADDLLNKIFAHLASIISGTATTEPLWEIRRNAHTLKGAAGAVGLDAVAELAHLFEDAVEAYSVSPDPDVCLLTDIAAALPLSIHQDAQLVRARISEFRSRIVGGPQKSDSSTSRVAHRPTEPKPLVSTNPATVARVSLLKVDRCLELSAALNDADDRLLTLSRSLADQSDELTDLVKLLNEITSCLPPSTEVAKLARELAVVENSLSRMVEEMEAEVDRGTSAGSEMARLAGSMRFICFGTIEPRLKGAMRAAADEAGTKCNLVIEHGETEIENVMLADLAEPIVHLLRNAAVHGIEPGTERVAKGKSEQGTITVDICRDQHSYRIAISDDGAGLNYEKLKAKAIDNGHLTEDKAATLDASEIAELIFLEGLSTAKALGMTAGRGVGMRIVRESVESKGGSLTVSSQPNHGTTFVLTVPVAAISHSFAAESGSCLNEPETKRQVLLVDDSPSVRYSAASILRKHGWEVTSAEDGSAAIEFLLRSTVLPDVIVSDLEMPKVDGLGFLRHLKADTRYENIPVVVCSSRKDPEHVESATSLGAATYLFKPFAETEFIQAVENAR